MVCELGISCAVASSNDPSRNYARGETLVGKQRAYLQRPQDPGNARPGECSWDSAQNKRESTRELGTFASTCFGQVRTRSIEKIEEDPRYKACIAHAA